MQELIYADLIQSTRHSWNRLSHEQKEGLSLLAFVQRIEGFRIYFIRGYREKGFRDKDIIQDLERTLRRMTHSAEVKYYRAKESPEEQFDKSLLDERSFAKLTFGSDVAEQDSDLMNYFITTKAFHRVLSRQRSVVIGPKGSGKSAI